MTLILGRSDLESLADMRSTIEAVEHAFAELARGNAHQPAPTSLQLPSSTSRFLPMTALADFAQLAVVKMLADIPDNQASGLPTQRSTIMLTSQHTGETLAVLDGQIPTRIRTAAASAVASKYLARPESTTLGLVGAGALAVAHVEAMREVLPISNVVVWSRTSTSAQSFCRRIEHHGLNVSIAETVQSVVQAADVLCTLTPSVDPIINGGWFTFGLHVNAVGARPRPDHREIDSTGMVRSTVFVDSLTTALAKSGELLIPISEGVLSAESVRAELGHVLTGLCAGRSTSEEITLYDSVGIGLQDLAVGRLLYDRALETGTGVQIDLSR